MLLYKKLLLVTFGTTLLYRLLLKVAVIHSGADAVVVLYDVVYNMHFVVVLVCVRCSIYEGCNDVIM